MITSLSHLYCTGQCDLLTLSLTPPVLPSEVIECGRCHRLRLTVSVPIRSFGMCGPCYRAATAPREEQPPGGAARRLTVHSA